MRLYRIVGRGWAGTQAEAKAKSRELGAPFHEAEVPTDKPGLLAFLDRRNVPFSDEGDVGRPAGTDAGMARSAPAATEQAPALGTEAERGAAAKAIQQGANAVADWILDTASQAQVEQLFAALGARVAEMRRNAPQR